jgi:hypothetical protein
VEVSESPADHGAELVQFGDLPIRERFGVAVVEVRVPVVLPALQAAVELRGQPTLDVREDVIDIAPRRRLVTS